MPTTVTKHLGIDPVKFDELGTYDSFLDLDSLLFIDPSLLWRCAEPEFIGAHQEILEHFQKILNLLDSTTVFSQNEATLRQAIKLFTFQEMPGFNLGYSDGHTAGSGLGQKHTTSILATVFELVKKGVKDPTLFELIPIFEEGVGCDRISDMVGYLLYKRFQMYTKRILDEAGWRLSGANSLPMNPFKKSTPIIVIPKCILTDLPVAKSWAEIDTVCAENERVRNTLNQILGNDWKNLHKKVGKSQIKTWLVSNPGLTQDLIEGYKRKKSSPYDFKNDPNGEFAWYQPLQSTLQQNPLALTLNPSPSIDEIEEVVVKICDQFKSMVEDKGLWEVLYSEDKKKPRKERTAQKCFHAIAESYCKANNLDITPESNAGNGPVDFKFSQGLKKICVEIKLSSNPKLKHAYDKQLPTYMASEESPRGILLIIEVQENSKKIQALTQQRIADLKEGKKVPKIIVVDGKKKQSASKR